MLVGGRSKEEICIFVGRDFGVGLFGSGVGIMGAGICFDLSGRAVWRGLFLVSGVWIYFKEDREGRFL